MRSRVVLAVSCLAVLALFAACTGTTSPGQPIAAAGTAVSGPDATGAGEVLEAFGPGRSQVNVRPAPTAEVAAFLTPEPDGAGMSSLMDNKPTLNLPAGSTRTPKKSPTPTPAPAGGKVIFSDDFSSKTKGKWMTGTADGIEVAIRDGQLQMTVDRAGLTLWSYPKNVIAGDARVEVEAQWTEDSPPSEIGLMLRKAGPGNDSEVYFFGVSNEGDYGFWLFDGEEFVELIPPTQSDAILVETGEVNVLAAEADGETFTFYINGEEVDQIDEDTSAEGLWGVYAGIYGDPGVSVAFDNFVLSELGEPEPPPDATPTGEPDQDVFTDDFSNARDGGWSQSDNDTTTSEIRDGKLFIEVREPNMMAWSATQNTVSDFELEVDAQWMDGSPKSEFGVMARLQKDGSQGSKFYTFAITPLGYYSVWMHEGGEWSAVVQWTESSAILVEPEEVNHLRVVVQGTSFAFYVNDEEMVTFEEDTIRRGGTFGLYAGTMQSDLVLVAFDNFVLGPPGK